MTPSVPRVLVVEDEEPLAELFEVWLDGPFHVDTETRGSNALETLSDEYDALVLDWRMPDVSGEDILSEINTRDIDCGVVIVTGFEPDIDMLDEHIAATLTKPVSSDELIEVLRDVV